MDNLIYSLFIAFFTPLVLMILLIDKKSRFPLIFVAIGIFMSLLSSEISGLIKKSFNLDLYYMTVTYVPITEEILKAIPILFFAIVISDKKEKLFTISMATGIGFAILENDYYLINSVNFNIIDAIIRVFGSALMHGMCTLLVGTGISYVKKKRKLFLLGTFALLLTAITYHSIYNMLIQSNLSIIGCMFPIITYIPFLISRIIKNKKRIICEGQYEK